MTIKRTVSSVRWYLNNMFVYLRNQGARKASVEKIAHFDLLSDSFHRYLVIFMLFLEDQGYTIELRHRAGFIGTWASRFLFKYLPGIRLTRRPPKAGSVEWLFTDRPLPGDHVLLDPDYFEVSSDDPKIPMPMAETFYLGDHRTPWHVDADATRRRALFFFGNMDPGYERPELGIAFGCMTRNALLDLLRVRFRKVVHEPINVADIDNAGARWIILMGRQKEYITPAVLRPTLARFDFFLAPSGTVMPLCHNVVEAMSAGCIPVLQYGHLFDPPLRHGKECLGFQNEEELYRVVEAIPSMPEEQVLAMRRAVLDYYTDHLTPKAVVNELKSRGNSLVRLRMNAEWKSTALLVDRIQRRNDQIVHTRTDPSLLTRVK